MIRLYRWLLVIGCWCLMTPSCGRESIFGPIGTQMANPLTVAVDSARARAYIINANNKDLYTSGSLHVVNLTIPMNPTRVNSTRLDSFSGQIALDVANRVLYVPNRLSDNSEDKSDHLFRINVNEASADFLQTATLAADGDPFGAAHVVARNMVYVPSREGFLDFYDATNSTPSLQTVDLKRGLSDGTTLSTADVTDIVVIGAQAFLSRASGGILVVNLDELTNKDANPVDYFINDVSSPRGLATDGVRLYAVSVATASDGAVTNALLVMNIGALTPTTATIVTGKGSLVTATISVGKNPQQVVVGTTEGFVSNMDDNTVTVFNVASGSVTFTASVNTEPFGMALYSPAGDTHLLVCNAQSNTVSIIDLVSHAVVAAYQ